MNELEKLKEEVNALKIILEMKDAHIDLLNKLNEASAFPHGSYILKEGECTHGGAAMPAERRNFTITINEDGTMSKTEE